MVFTEEDIDDCDEEESDDDDQYECNSQCENPCTNQKHIDNKDFVNIIEKALRENNFDTESVESQRFYQNILNSNKSKPIFMRQSPKEDEEEEKKEQSVSVSDFS